MLNVLQTREDVCILTDIRDSNHELNPYEISLSLAATCINLPVRTTISMAPFLLRPSPSACMGCVDNRFQPSLEQEVWMRRRDA